MQLKEVPCLPPDILQLINHIDRGEFQLARQGEAFPGFQRWIYQGVFLSPDNCGALTAFVFNKALRIHLVFAADPPEEARNSAISMLQSVIGQNQLESSVIWCTQDNPLLVSEITDKLPIEPGIYRSSELAFPRANINPEVDTGNLSTRAYQEENLLEFLDLLEQAFQQISRPGDFYRQRDYYHRKFSNTTKGRSIGFYLDNQLVGLFQHNDGEIEYLAVSPAYQSKGYGSLILKSCVASVLSDSEQEPYLYCVNENPRALAFYLREGWQVTGRAVKMVIKQKATL